MHVLVARLLLGNLHRLAAGFWEHTVLLDVLLVRKVKDLHSNLDSRVLGGLFQYGPHPVSPEEDALLRSHGCAVEGVCHVEVDTLRDVGH